VTALLLLLTLSLGVGASDAPTPLDEPPLTAPVTDAAALELLTEQVSDGLRCPTCQGLSVNDSPAEGARAMKSRIRELVAQGYTKEQIDDYFVDRYGTWVLLSPPAEGRHWAVWLAPVGFLLVGGAVAGGFMRARKTGAGAETASVEPEELDELEPWRQRILAELERP